MTYAINVQKYLTKNFKTQKLIFYLEKKQIGNCVENEIKKNEKLIYSRHRSNI